MTGLADILMDLKFAFKSAYRRASDPYSPHFLRHGFILRQIVYVADHNTHQHSNGKNDHVAHDVDSNERAG